MKLLIVGAGWAGLSAAVWATLEGHDATVLEASRAVGGRARAAFDLKGKALDNGQHILIGAYSQTLTTLREVGVDVGAALLRLPLTLQYPDGGGLQLPDWRAPLFKGADVAMGVLRARGWGLRDKIALLRVAQGWQRAGFACDERTSVAQLCAALTPRVMQDMIEPLVVSALNTPAERASGQVFLRVMRDALFAAPQDGVGGSNLLLPRCDLGALFPNAALAWLQERSVPLHLGHRLQTLERNKQQWRAVAGDFAQDFDTVLLATAPWDSARLLRDSHIDAPAWLRATEGLQHEAITTVYAHARGARLAQPMLALRSTATQPAQFVFDRGQLTNQPGVLAFVVSASQGEGAVLQEQVIAQGRAQLNLPHLQPLKTIVEKRATFACTPGVQRPGAQIAPGLLACGDYVQGLYPATLEGAVRSAIAAVKMI